jgi:hypothetical protein
VPDDAGRSPPALRPARVAGRKGHSFVGCSVIGLFFFPLALVMAHLVKDRAGLHAQGAHA